MNDAEIDASRWELMLTLLSLDSVAPFYEAMGLHVPDKQQLQQQLRRQIREHRQTAGAGAPFNPDEWAQTLRRIADTCGQQTAEHFRAWATNVFFSAHADLSQWSAWDIILPHYPDDLPGSLGLSAENFAPIVQFHAASTVRDVEQQISAMRVRPLSNWDEETYALNQYSNVEDPMCEDDFVDPFAFILATIKMNRFQLGWEQLWQHFTPEEKNDWWAYGQQVITNEEIDMPEQLRHPDNLKRERSLLSVASRPVGGDLI